MSNNRNEEQKKRFAVWQSAADEAERAKKAWGVSSPHNAREAQDRADMAFRHWRAA